MDLSNNNLSYKIFPLSKKKSKRLPKTTRMLTKEKNNAVKKTFKNSDTLLNAHTLHHIYANALDFSQNKSNLLFSLSVILMYTL